MVGEHDPLTTPAMCRELADQIKGAAYSIVSSAGHLSNIENPTAFKASALGFIDSISTKNKPAGAKRRPAGFSYALCRS